ncbi:hypothetical protein Q3G72_032651 [Acer saccharum]|nr:hypothetical protein Q3G72_032651 [Acer saccharum]
MEIVSTPNLHRWRSNGWEARLLLFAIGGEPEIAATASIVPPLLIISDITPSDQITRLLIGHASLRWEKMEQTKEAMPTAPMSNCVSLSFTDDGDEWRDGESGGMEKVENKQAKSESHARWKVCMWGGKSENGRNSMALSSASMRREKGGSYVPKTK